MRPTTHERMLRRLRGFISGEVGCGLPLRSYKVRGRAHGPDILPPHLSFADFPLSSRACGECHVHAEMSCGYWKSWTWGARPWLRWGVIKMVSVARITRIQDPAPGRQAGTERPRSNLHQGSQSPKAPEPQEVPAPTAGFFSPPCEDTLLD